MKITQIGSDCIETAIGFLKSGGLIIYPTETVYGIGADATNVEAIKKLAEYKNRPLGKPYSIAVADQKMAENYVDLNDTARKLYKEFLPGPLTIISKGKHNVASGVESEDGTLGVRIPDYKLVTDIVKAYGKPITSTSANASYKRRPYKVSDILENISDKQKKLIGLIIDIGELPHNEPSTVIDTTLDDPVTLRQGEIKFKNQNQILSRSEENTQNFAKEVWQKYDKYYGKKSIIFALQGEMGAGKTQFTKGLARAMGISELITSPTFALENIYSPPTAKNSLHHFDAWRLENSDELKALGFKDLIQQRNVIAVEWAEKVLDIIRTYDDEAVVVWVKIKFGAKDNERIITWGNL